MKKEKLMEKNLNKDEFQQEFSRRLNDEELAKVCGGEDDFEAVITTAGEPDSAVTSDAVIVKKVALKN